MLVVAVLELKEGDRMCGSDDEDVAKCGRSAREIEGFSLTWDS